MRNILESTKEVSSNNKAQAVVKTMDAIEGGGERGTRNNNDNFQRVTVIRTGK